MTRMMLATDDALPLFHKAVRDQFQEGGSYGSVVLTLAGLAAVVLAVHLLQRWYDRSQEDHSGASHPAKLFNELLARLDLSPSSRKLLTDVIRDQKLRNPTALLISCRLFDTHTLAWQEAHTSPDGAAQIASVRVYLFGSERA